MAALCTAQHLWDLQWCCAALSGLLAVVELWRRVAVQRDCEGRSICGDAAAR